MYIDGLVFGLLDTSKRIERPALAARMRSFTISWSRYGYHDLILENDDINGLLDEASALGYEFCLVQAYGHLIAEQWFPPHLKDRDFQSSLARWIAERDFFVAGQLTDEGQGRYALGEQCLLVNLRRYTEFGRPRFTPAGGGPTRLVKPLRSPEQNFDGSGPLWLSPSAETETLVPDSPGRGFIDASLKHGKVVYNFDESLDIHRLALLPEIKAHADEFSRYLGEGIKPYGGDGAAPPSNGTHRKFLSLVARQVNNVRRGVFLWNVESYEDVRQPPHDFSPPVSTLYSVAAGFKPNMILQTHGFDEETRIVFFDYSPNALEIKKEMRDEWDGDDFPRFVKYLFKKFPEPETFYHFWHDATPEMLQPSELERYWQDETAKWGGAEVFKEHWRAYRKLKHEYVRCDILTEQSRLLERMDERPGSVIWWSNAFFTVFSNWFHTMAERKKIYDGWIESLAAKCPGIFLYGADYNNISVNCLRAGPYWEEYSRHGGDCLDPLKLHKHEIRF